MKYQIKKSLILSTLLMGLVFLFAHTAKAATFDVTSYPIPSGENEAQYITSSPDGNIWFVERAQDKLSKISAMIWERDGAGLTIVMDCHGDISEQLLEAGWHLDQP